MLIVTATPVSARSNRIIRGYDKYYGNCFSEVKSGSYKYKLYKNLKKGTIIYTGSFVTDIMWHSYGRTGKTVEGSRSMSYSFDTTQNWNSSIGASIGIGKNVTASANKGYGTSLGWGVSSSFTRKCSLDESGIKNGKSGYYTLAAGKPNYKIHWRKVKNSNGSLKSEGAFYMPSGEVGLFIVRSLDHQETWVLFESL